MELETLQNNLIPVALLAILLGGLIGWLITYLAIGRGPSKTELTSKLEAVEEEFSTHKESVDQHFSKTSELVNELTESYVKVYKHLSDGAEQLSGVVDMRNRITLDESPDAIESNVDTAEADDDDKVIEGSLAATATTAVAASVSATGETEAADNISEEMARADDPEFMVSDAAVEETLTELEVSAADTKKKKA